jgi:hypothetical protein
MEARRKFIFDFFETLATATSQAELEFLNNLWGPGTE